MKKTSIALLAITLVNVLNLIRYGFDWATSAAVALALICIALDVKERWFMQ